MSLTICKRCGHERNAHRGVVCGRKDCDCLCSLEVPLTKSELPPIDSLPAQWEEEVIMRVFDAVFNETEDDITIPTSNGTDCKVKVRFTPSVGYHVVPGGKA